MVRSRFEAEEAAAYVRRYGETYGEDLALRVYTSRLLGADPTLVLHGGGNTSVKSTARELTGESTDVLFVKGSGWDLSTIEPAGFPACRLGPLLALCDLESLSDDRMVRGLRGQMLDPSSPTPSVEALLHAFIPGKFVDHTHANAVLSVVDQPDGGDRARAVFGDELLFVPYVMPGFLLARRVYELRHELSDARVLVLDKHGIFTWGDTAEESYRRMIEAVQKAEEYVAVSSGKTARVFAPSSSPSPAAEERRRRQRFLSPILRGALELAAGGQKFVVSWRDDPEILGLLARPDAQSVTAIGPATPDHVIRTKPTPLWLESASADVSDVREAVRRALDVYRVTYERYFDENATRYSELKRLDPLPRVVLVPGVGALTAGKTLKDALVVGDIYRHTASIIDNAASLGSYVPVGPSDLFDVEYWSLEQAKLKISKSAGGPLDRFVAAVTGAARGIGHATVTRFLELGAHVVASDRDPEALEQGLAALTPRFGDRVFGCVADVTRGDAVASLFDAAVLRFGGVDVVVSNAGNAPSGVLHTEAGARALETSLVDNLLSHQTVARAATEVFLSQDTGGCLLFNASKSAFNPGPDFGPYAVPKAAVLALMRQYAVDLGAHGIRANAVNADRIHTSLFSDALVTARAKARGVPPDEYFRQNLLHRETTARDVADAFVYLATAPATTGCVVTVDGGNAAAFPR